MIITIGRECGCNGNKIGRALAEKYHMAFYDKSVISKCAQDKGIYDRYPDFYKEVPGNTLMYTISIEEDEESVLYETPKKALSGLIGTKDCVLLGRCGNWAFKDRDDKISIFLTGH
jgi:cytidylate kinase